MKKIQVSIPPEFSFRLNLEFLTRSPREILHRVVGETVYKLIKIQEETIAFTLRESNGCLEIEFFSDVRRSLVQGAVEYVQRWFDLETDLKPFYRMARKDKLLAPLVKKYRGYRIMGQPDLFEALTWAVLGQQINLGFAYTLKQRLVEKFGESQESNAGRLYVFPDFRVLARVQPAELLEMQFSRQKAAYTIEIARAFASGKISTRTIGLQSFDEAKATLMKIKGIGNWTANYALMKTYHYRNAFPLEDAGLHNALKNLMKLKEKPDLHRVRKIFKKYNGWEAYATLYLWKSL